MFTDRLHALMAALGLTPPALAKAIGCDRSNIDRICKGTRVPRKNGKSARSIVDALYACADDAGNTETLLRTVPCADPTAGEEIRKAMMAWLFAEAPENGPEKQPAAKQRSCLAFGKRLNAVMELTGLSNARLGRLLHVDSSYISRFRRGQRSPAANRPMADSLCEILLAHTREQGLTPRLASLMGAPETALASDDAALRALHGWLFDLAPADHAPLVMGMLDGIGGIRELAPPPLSFAEAAPHEALSETAPVYFGREGLQRAVLRFLGNVVRQKPERLLLYSDQDMNWMVADPVFRARWATLMALVVTGGTQIRIIHNVDRDLNEMAAAIRSWLPLYPSGMIRSYYNKAPNVGRFSETLFLCPGFACISGANVRGAEDDTGLYRYDTAPAVLAAQEEAFLWMLGNAGELAHVEPAEDTGRFGGEDVENLTVLGDTLTLATMPEPTLLRALERIGANEETKARLRVLRKERLEILTRAAEKGFLHEYLPLPAAETLQQGGVLMDLPGLRVAYTPEDYADHVRNVLALLREYPQYRFLPLPAPVFPEMQVLIAQQAVSVMRRTPPSLAVRFSHPGMCRAFMDFAEKTRAQYKQDRLAVKKELEQYL